MKALIEKLASGNIEYTRPALEVSIEEIDIVLPEGQKEIVEFYIDSKNNKEIKGVVSCIDPRVELLNNQFYGKHNLIRVLVDAQYLVAGTKIEDALVVTSNSGEYKIPVKVNIEGVELSTSIGSVTKLPEFMQLVSHDYDEALKLFLSKSFKMIFLKDDVYKCTVYDSLMRNLNREIAMEEFLVAMELKKQVDISISENRKIYENITEAYAGSLQIARSCKGYVEIDVEITGDFIDKTKNKITSDDFVGNVYEYQYLINSFKLHQGENRAKIIFKTTTQAFEYDIIVNNPANDVSEHIANSQNIINIMKAYIDFRCGNMSGNKWVADMSILADKMMDKNPESMVPMLLKTQASILAGDEEKAVSMLGQLSQRVNSTDPEKIEYYCYYLYLRAIHKKNASFTDDIKREIKMYFENGYDKWGLLWMILYLDDRYTQNPSLKYTLIKEQFNKGCTSPVMYYEAIAVLNDQPALLRIMNPFEIQVINFGAKKGIISEKLARQIMILFEKEKKFDSLVLSILMRIYKIRKENFVLDGICRMLINGGKVDGKYHEWYEKAVREELKIAELMEYYIYSVSDKGYKSLLPAVYMYFNYSAKSLAEYQAYLYANIIYNKKVHNKIYNKNKDAIEKYAISQLAQGAINRDLVIVYEDVFGKTSPEESMISVVPTLANSYEIVVDNDNITEVVVCHKEADVKKRYSLTNGKAIIAIFTDKPVLVFEDNSGRKLVNIKYKLEKLINIKSIIDLAEKSEDKLIEIKHVNQCMEKPQDNKGQSALLEKVWKSEVISEVYRHKMSKFLIKYCTSNYDAGELTETIKLINPEELDNDIRIKYIELLIAREQFTLATTDINKYGLADIDKKLLHKYVSEIIKEGTYESDEKHLSLCRYLFVNGIYDAVTLGYLQTYYEGPTEEMIDMAKACSELQISNFKFEERVLGQMIFEGRIEERMLDIFKTYAKEATNANIIKAFFTYTSYHYFNKGVDVKADFFDILEKALMEKVRIAEICKMAYLSHMTKQEKINQNQIELCKDLIYELTEINVVFEFYKVFNKWFNMPYSIMDKTIIDYRTNPKNKVFIMYVVYDENGNAGKSYTEEMSSVYPGIFIKQLTLFYGERVTYTIVDKDNDEIVHSDEHEIKMTRKDVYNEQNKFGQINGMIISESIGREDALDELMKNYEYNRQASESLFKII